MSPACRQQQPGRRAFAAGGYRVGEAVGTGIEQALQQARRRQAAKYDGLRIEEVLDHGDSVAEQRCRPGDPVAFAEPAAPEAVEGHIALEASAIAAGAGLAVWHHRDVTDLASIAPCAAKHRAIMHHGAAETDAEVVEVRKGPSVSVKPFAEGGSSHICLQEDRHAGLPSQALSQVDIVPAGHRGRADKAHRLDVERARHGEADTEHPLGGAAVRHFRHEFADDGEGFVRADAIGLPAGALEHVAVEIDEGGIDAQWRQVDADGVAAVRIDAKLRRRHAAALGLLTDRQDVVVLFEFTNDR